MASKYHSKKVTDLDGNVFQSKREYRRWNDLQLLGRAGMIKNLRRQVKFVLIPAQRINGKIVERECSYIADFVYEADGKTVVEDCKGFRTDTYKLKRKMMLYKYGIRILET